jgi:hypothetical protein
VNEPHDKERAAPGTRTAAWKRFGRWASAGFGCLLAVGLIEAGLRLFWRQELASWPKNMNATVPLDPGVMTGVAGPARIVTDGQGLRGTEHAARRSGEYRILVIGGSNAACALQDQPNTWPALLQARFPSTPDGRRVWVGNAGHGGHNSRHHVMAMRYMLDSVDPDAVIVLIGGNEKILSEGPSYDPGFIDDDGRMHDLARDFDECPVPFREKPRGWRGTRLGTFLTRAADRLRRKNGRGIVADVEGIRRSREARRRARLFIDRMPDIQKGLEGYGRNVREMIRLARTHRVRLVFATSPTLLKPGLSAEEAGRLWAGRFGPPAAAALNAYWSPRVHAAVLAAHDRALIEICREEGVECVDLASMIPRTLDNFWDQAHFTDAGCRRVADALAVRFAGGPDRGTARRGASASTPGRPEPPGR